MMNFYGDDRKYLDGDRYKKATITEKIVEVLGYLNPALYIGAISRSAKIARIEKEIKNVDCKDTKKLEDIVNKIYKNDLENRNRGKIISSQSIEKLITKIIQNDNKILKEKEIEYFLGVAKENKENKISARIKTKQENKKESKAENKTDLKNIENDEKSL